MKKETMIAHMNKMRPPFLDMLNCVITDADAEKGICEMDFEIGKQFCHSVNIVQGGFVTAMLDAVSSHAVFGTNQNIVGLSTLELKVSYFAASKSGKFHAIGRIEKLTRNFAFLSADLYNATGERTASLTSTAKISLKKER